MLSIKKRVLSWLVDNGITSSIASSKLEGMAQFIDLLPYDVFEQQTELFFNKNSMGFGLELAPIVGGTESLCKSLHGLLNDILPSPSNIQILVWGSQKIEKKLSSWSHSCSEKSITNDLVAKRKIFLQTHAITPLSSQHEALLRHTRLFLFVSLPLKMGSENKSEQLVQVRNKLQSTLNSHAISTTKIQAQMFISFMLDLLYPETDLSENKRRYQRYNSLSQHLTKCDKKLELGPDEITVSDAQQTWGIRCLHVDEFPEGVWNFWDNRYLIGDLFNVNLQFISPFVISVGIHISDSETSLLQAGVKATRAQQLAVSPLGRFLPSTQEIAEDWQYTKERLGQRDRLVKLHYQVCVMAPPEKLDNAETKAIDIYRARGWHLRRDRYLQLGAWLSCLPMTWSEGLVNDLKQFKRLHTFPTQAATHFLPLLGEWRGAGEDGLLLVGRSGQLFCWDNFIENNQGNSNYNVCVVASSGAGKSVLINEKIMNDLRRGHRVWVIDVGRSYEKLCHLLDGEFLSFGPQTQLSLNPFSHIQDIQLSLDILKPLLALMARPTCATSDEENTFLEKAITHTWDIHGTQNTITEVAHYLDTLPSRIAKNLSHLLYPYTKNGMYGNYFHGESNFKSDNNFVVLELEELKSRRDLQQVVLWALIQQISETLYLSDRSLHKSVIIDEAWDLMQSDNNNAKRFIESICRRSRKYNGCLITITQSTQEYFSNSAARAAWELSDWRLFLKQNPDAITAMREQHHMEMSSDLERLLCDLKRTDDYSELVICGQGQYALGRLILDPFAKMLYSSKGSDVETIKHFMSQGLSLSEAIARASKGENQ